MALSIVPSPERSRTRTCACADRIGIGDDVIGQRHHRLRIAGAERPARAIVSTSAALAPAALTAPSISSAWSARAAATPSRQFAFEIGAELRERAVLAP